MLIIGFVWPEPQASAAGSRMMQIIESFLAKDYSIVFASANTKNKQAYNLEAIGISEVNIKLNCSSFDDYIKKINPDLVLFDRFMTEEQFGWRVSENCPKAIRILDTEDLHGLRKGREQAFKDQIEFNLDYLYNDTAKREIASIYRSDLSLIISEAEMAYLINDFKVDANLLCYLPFMLEGISEETQQTLPTFEERQHFISIGNFLHPPNNDAVYYLKQIIWPLISAQLPQAELHIYGAYVSEKTKQLHNEKERFYIKGFVEDVNPVMQNARICLAPLRYGAGLKGKLIDGMLNGTPSMMSTLASEGIFGEMEPNGFIEDDPKSFADKAVKLYEDELLWKNMQANGFNLISERFKKSIFQKIFFDKLDEVKANLEERRMKNFTGQMLQHHTLLSTKYMGKWIEEKNKHKSHI